MRPNPLCTMAGLLLAACGSPPATEAPRPPPPLSGSSSAAASASPPTSASPPASASAAQGPASPPATEASESPPDPTLGTIDAPSPPAPCDFARFYRGAMDAKKFSIVLRRSGGSLRGASAYDSGFGELELTGEVGADNRFLLHERKEGKEIATLEGACAADSGVLAGKWKQGAVERAFSLRPREAGGVGLVERRRRLGKVGDTMPLCDLEIDGYPVREERVREQVPARVLRELVRQKKLPKARYKKLVGRPR